MLLVIEAKEIASGMLMEEAGDAISKLNVVKACEST